MTRVIIISLVVLAWLMLEYKMVEKKQHNVMASVACVRG